MDLEKLVVELKRDEGLRLSAYQDTLGYWTIGYGHQSPTIHKGMAISEKKAESLLMLDIGSAIEVAKLYLDPVALDSLSDNRQRALVNMAFNLGTGIFSFRKLKQAIVDGEWSKASRCALDSLWAAQVKGRAVRISYLLEIG